MAKVAGDSEDSAEQKAAFIDTNLDTHLAILVSVNDTVLDLKRKIRSEHLKCFQKFGEIEIHALKVRCKKKDYCLSDVIPVGIVFGGVADKWFLSADVSPRAVCYDAVGYDTEFHHDHNLLMLPGPHLESPLKRHRRNDGGNLLADNLSSDTGSGNLQMLVVINNEDNLKSSSSDTYKRLNPNADGILNGSSEKDIIPLVDSKRTGNSSGLIAEVTSVNPNKETLGKNKVKRKKKVNANVSALGDADAVEVANVLIGGLNHNKEGDESVEIDHLRHSSLDLKNRNVLEGDKRMDSQGEEDRVFKSQYEDVLVKRSNKTKLTGKKNSKRKTKDEVADDVVSRDIDASLSISAKPHSLPAEGSVIVNVEKNTVNDQLIGGGNNDVRRSISPDGLVVSNPQTTEKLDSSSGNNHNMDEDKTEGPLKIERALDAKDRERETKTVGAVAESKGKKSNKRKKNEGAAPNQTDAKGEGNHGIPDVGEMEEEMTRPSKRTKIWDNVLDIARMVGIENEEPGEPMAGDNERNSKATGVALTSETTRANEKKKNEFDNAARHSPLVGEPDELRLDEHVVSENVQTTQRDADEKAQQMQVSNSDDNEAKQPKLSQSSMIASAAKSAGRKQKVKMRKSKNGMEDMKGSEKLVESASLFSTSGLGDEPSKVDSTEREKLLKFKSKPEISVRLEDNFGQSDAEPQKLIQNQKSKDDADGGSKVAKKKTRKKQASAMTNISEITVKDQNLSVKPERSESSRPPKFEALRDDVDEFSSSHPERAYEGNAVVTMEADVETKSKKGELDDEVHSNNHGEASVMNHTDAESVKFTQVQKSGNGDGSKNKKSRKSKQKQSPAVKSISEPPAKDENISMKFDMSNPTRAKKPADEDDKMEPSSACQERTDKADSVISAKPDIEIAKGAVQGEAPLKTHGGDVVAHIEADETRQDDAEPMQLTKIQSERNNDTKRKPKRKAKQNNTVKVERSRSTYSKSEAEKGEMESSSSPVEQVSSVPQSDAVTSIAKVENVNIPNHGRDDNAQQEAKDAPHVDAEPIMLTQVQASEGDTKPKKRTKQQLPKDSQTARDDTKNDHSLEKDPNQTDAKGEGNHGIPDVGEMEDEMTRPNKRTKIWDNVLDVARMVGTGNEEPGEPIAGGNERNSKATGVALTSETTRANEKKKNEFDNAARHSPLGGEPDKLRLDEHVVPENIQTTQRDAGEIGQQIQVSNSDDNEAKHSKFPQSSMIASAAKSAVRKREVKMRKSNNGMEDMKDREKLAVSASLFSTSGLGDERSTVDSTERDKPLKLKSKPEISVRLEDNFSQGDTEPQKLIQNQKSKDDTDGGSKVAKKKTRKKRASAMTNISEFTVKDQSLSIKPERSESSRPPKSEALLDDVDESSSSHPERAYKGNTVVTMEADIETKSKKGELDDEVHSNNRGEASDMNHTDAESVKFTQVRKSDNGDGSKNKKSRKSKQKRSPAVKSISEPPAKDENISMKFDMSDPTRAKKPADGDDKMEPSSACQERTDKADSVISAKPDIETAKGAVQGEAPLKTHGGDVGAHIEADETRQNDAEPMQRTQIQSERNDDTKRKPKRKTKQNNTMKVERSKSTYSKSEAEKGEMESSSSPVEQVSSVPQSDAVMSIAKVENTNIPNHDNTQPEAKDASHADAEPIMSTQTQISEGGTKPKKRTKQQLTGAEKNPPKDSQTAQDDTSGEHHLEKDPKDARVKIPPNASKNTVKERTSDRTELRESTDMGLQKGPVVLSGAKRSKAGSPIKPNKNDDSESSSAESDSPFKSSHQGKAKKQLPKMEQRRSGVPVSSSKSAGKVAQKPAVMRSLISKSSSIFNDASSSSSEDKGGNSDSSTETPNNRSSSSDSSDGESRGSWMSPKRGNPKEDGGLNSLSQSIPNKLPIESIFRSSRKYKKAKVIASQLQMEDDESQPVDVVPDSQADV